MNIRETIATINRMQADGIIDRYAIALQTGRAKDKARLLQFIEDCALDAARFQAILARHDLVDRWRQFEQQFLTP